MKKLLTALVLFTCVAGCMLPGCTSVETTEEHVGRLAIQSDLQFRLLVDDFDSFWMFDRNCRLTRWPNRVGW